MKPTITSLRPVVTLLSGSRKTSLKVSNVLAGFFNMDEIDLSASTNKNDALDSAYAPFLNQGCNSIGCEDKESGTIIHLLSLSNDADADQCDLSLLSVTDSENDNDDAAKCVQEARDEIFRHIDKSPQNAMKLVVLKALKQTISPQNLTSLELPLLVLSTNTVSNDDAANVEKRTSSTKLRELAIPFNHESTYADGSSLLQKLSQSNLTRPKTGLYQMGNGGLVLRPVPSATSDMTLPFPSFIFQCDSLKTKQQALINAAEGQKNIGVALSKLGCNGIDPGQMLIHNHDVQGLELRFCEARQLSSSFVEAQESLMAGSLDDLQNVNVMVEGGKTRSQYDVKIDANKSSNQGATKTRADVMNGLGDCWVEFRANIKSPLRFFDKKARTRTVPRIAKAPDIPYE